jgi:putative membrane protein insertion efficiency factor
MMLLRRAFTFPLRVYQRWISPLKPPMCRFAPTCSQYAVEAIELHGILRGSWYSLGRILRCHPLCKGGFDPVPGSEMARKHEHACSRETEERTSAADKPRVERAR